MRGITSDGSDSLQEKARREHNNEGFQWCSDFKPQNVKVELLHQEWYRLAKPLPKRGAAAPSGSMKQPLQSSGVTLSDEGGGAGSQMSPLSHPSGASPRV